MIGRRAELELLGGEVRRVREGQFRVVLIEGPAGVGKTRLVTEATARIPSPRHLLSARSYRLGVTASFGPWLEALDRHTRVSDGASVWEVLGLEVASQPSRISILERMTSVLDDLSREQPVYLTLDDIHLSDASSWEALRFTARRLWTRPIGVIATTRTGEAENTLLAKDVLMALADDDLLRRVSLRPLNSGETGDLARAMLSASDLPLARALPESLVTWLQDRSRGHPLFVIRLLDALVEQGGDLHHPELDRLPRSLRDRLETELADLGEADRRVLEGLAVLDQRTDLGTLSASLRLDETVVAPRLSSLTSARLVTEEHLGDGLVYEVAHPLIQEATYELMGGASRSAAHKSAARVLMSMGRRGAAAAHYTRSASRADDESLAALCTALREAEASGLHREALAILEALLTVLPRGDERWRTVLDAISWQAEWVIDHLAEQEAGSAIHAMERIREVVRESKDAMGEAIVECHLAAFRSIGTAELDAAEKSCRRAIERFREAGAEDRSLLAANELVWVHSCRGEFDVAMEVGASLLRSLPAGVDPTVEVQLAGSTGYAAVLLGRYREAEEYVRRAALRAREVGNRYREAWGLVQWSLALGMSGRLEEALSAVAEARRIGEDLAADALWMEREAHYRLLRGELRECARLVQESDARRPARGSRRRAWSLALAARAEAELGRLPRARRALEQAEQTYGQREILDWSAWAPWARAGVSMISGDPAGAVRAYARASDRYASIGARPLEGVVLFEAVDCAMVASERKRARRLADRLADVAGEVGGALHPPLAAVATGWVGDDPAQARHVGAAAERLEALGYRLFAMIAWFAAGDLWGRRNDPAEQMAWERAARLADECSASWRRDRALKRLAAVGSEGRRAVSRILGPSSLTPREREVARLAARGHTARQIAEQLYIGRRTVETHLSNIYPKLGIRTKRDLVVRGGELGLTESA